MNYVDFRTFPRLKVAVLLTMILSPNLFAEQNQIPAGPLTLDKAVEEAMVHSPQVQKAQAAVKEAGWKKAEVFGAGFLPRISATAYHYFSPQYTLTNINFGGNILTFPGFYPNTVGQLNVTIPIFNGLSNVRQLQAASLMENASEKELSRTQFQLAEDIQLAFYQALAAAQLEDVAEENVKTLEDHLRQVKVQRQGGVATSYDTLRVEVQLNEARADAIDAKDNVEITRKKLTQLIGSEYDERALEGFLPTPDAEKVKNIEIVNVATDRTDLQALNLRAEAADKIQSAQNAWIIPSISVGGEYQLYDSQVYNQTVMNTGNYQSAYNVGIFLKWNLFDGGVGIAQANEAAYQAIQSDKASRIAKLQVPYDFAYWKRRYVSNSDHYLSKKFDITRSQESVRLAKAEERAGTRTSTETLDAELDLFRAKAGVVTAQVNAVEAQIKLELALGRKI
jgi:outer membrane protein TolC